MNNKKKILILSFLQTKILFTFTVYSGYNEFQGTAKFVRYSRSSLRADFKNGCKETEIKYRI